MKHRTVTVDLNAEPVRAPRRLAGPWWGLAGGGAFSVLAIGWIVLSGAVTLGWLGTVGIGFGTVLRLATQWLALAHGVPAELPPLAVGIVPLGLTLLFVVLSVPIASLAARQAASTSGVPDDTGVLRAQGGPIVWRVTIVFASVYTLTLLLVTTTLFGMGTGWRALIGGALVSGGAGFWGAARGVGYNLFAGFPWWARRVPRALGLALLTLTAGGATVLTIALWAGRAQMQALTDSLGGGIVAAILLLFLQLFYLPNAVLWCISWMLGAGVQLGEGSSITMVGSEVGFLPAVPLLGAVPHSIGAWASAWLAVGVVAGVLAASAVLLDRPRARPLKSMAAGALAGAASAVMTILLCLVSGGGLGSGRMSWLGPDRLGLLLLPPVILVVAGALTGLVIGVWRRLRLTKPWQRFGKPAAEGAGEDDEADHDRTPEDDEAETQEAQEAAEPESTEEDREAEEREIPDREPKSPESGGAEAEPPEPGATEDERPESEEGDEETTVLGPDPAETDLRNGKSDTL